MHMFIPDSHCPVIIPFGYACIGKTMLIQRLLRYLRKIGYCAVPESLFRSDPLYPEICKKYMDEVYGNKVAAETAANGTILLRIIDKRGMVICYLLDIAGKFQYNIHEPHKGISTEMQCFFQIPNPIIWGFMIENGMQYSSMQRQGYVEQIYHYAYHLKKQNFYSKQQSGTKNRVLYIYNKIDRCPSLERRGLFESANSLYPGIFVPFRETNTLLQLLCGKYRFRLQPFHSVYLYENRDVTYVMDGNDLYPKELWSYLYKLIR